MVLEVSLCNWYTTCDTHSDIVFCPSLHVHLEYPRMMRGIVQSHVPSPVSSKSLNYRRCGMSVSQCNNYYCCHSFFFFPISFHANTCTSYPSCGIGNKHSRLSHNTLMVDGAFLLILSFKLCLCYLCGCWSLLLWSCGLSLLCCVITEGNGI